MKALYAGSFDCYTNGHRDIVRKASDLFDEVHILVADNAEKSRSFPSKDMIGVIERDLEYSGITNCIVRVCDMLVAEYAVEHGIKYLVRGLRNSIDYQYEENMATINREICPELETIYLRTNNAAISSSMVRDVLKYGRDISRFVPRSMCEYLQVAAPAE